MSRSPLTPPSVPSPQPSEGYVATLVDTLRVVLVLALDREELADICWGSREAAYGRTWPSSFYRLSAEATYANHTAWGGLTQILEQRLQPWLTTLGTLDPIELTRLFTDAPALMNWRQLAAALWLMVRDRDPAYASLLSRSRQELEYALLSGARSRVI